MDMTLTDLYWLSVLVSIAPITLTVIHAVQNNRSWLHGQRYWRRMTRQHVIGLAAWTVVMIACPVLNVAAVITAMWYWLFRLLFSDWLSWLSDWMSEKAFPAEYEKPHKREST